MSTNQTENVNEYATKLDKGFTQAVEAWWNGLSKHEVLTYLDEQPTITADQIREMLANENCTLSFGVQFSVASKEAYTDFQQDK